MKNAITRREMLRELTVAVPLLAAAPSLFGAPKRLGVCGYSYNLHWKAVREGSPKLPFRDTIDFIEYCHGLGAGGVQIALESKEPGFATRLRARAEAHQMYLEGQVTLPRNASDLDRFEAELRASKEAGAQIVRTTSSTGRRYETFDSAEAFRQFADRVWQSLTLAEPILKKHCLRLAIENHKDWRVAELLEILKRLNSEWIGVCLDTGNSIALLEEPMSVIEHLAPFAISSHLKDMAVQEYEDGFLLSEVALGEGFLDLKRIVALLRDANPKLQFTLEMITRDPLKIPCLTKSYFAAMPMVPAGELAAALTNVRRHAWTRPLPRTTGLNTADQLALEDENVRKCFAYAGRELPM
jgi:sugar phosphate isomerase/epimerase